MSKEYKVGFAKPPKKTQFKKGKSGNPKGRPKKSINTINFMEQEFQSEIQVKEGNQTIVMTKQQAIIKQVINKAVKGDFKSAVLTLEHMKHIDEYKEQAQAVIESIRKDDKSILDAFVSRVNKTSNEVEVVGE